MMIILFNIIFWLIFFVFLGVLFLLFLWMWSIIKSKTPFIAVPNKILPDIEKLLDLKDDSVVYNLGCGDGRVLFYLSKKKSKAKYIGIENSFFPYLLAQTRLFWYKRKKNINISIINEDFFNTDLSKATHVFTYLYPNIMDDILPKLDKELKPGTKLFSISFHFTGKREVLEIDLKRGKYQLAKKIYVYEF